jgi:RNA polymerase sigma-70 factor (ECF subfamily)
MSEHEPQKAPGLQPLLPQTEKLVEAVIASRPALLRQARRMLRDESGAEDAAQDAIVQALSHLSCFRGDAQLGTWLYRVGANAVLMTLRRERRASQRTVRAASGVPDGASWLHGSSSQAQAQAQLEAGQASDLLRWAIEQLPEHYRCVVVQCDLDEKPVQEVAAALGLTVGGVRTRRLRAHRLLRTALRGRRGV